MSNAVLNHYLKLYDEGHGEQAAPTLSKELLFQEWVFDGPFPTPKTNNAEKEPMEISKQQLENIILSLMDNNGPRELTDDQKAIVQSLGLNRNTVWPTILPTLMEGE